MTDAFSKLAPLLADPYARAREEKRRGTKVVGITPMHFPEELVHASGALPVIMQESSEPVTMGFGQIYPFYCGFSRSNIDLAAKGKQDLFDAIVVSDMCLQTRHMSHIMRRNMPKVPFVYVQWPLEADTGRWLSVTVERLQRGRAALETALGTSIHDDALRASIALYNRHRALLRRLHDLRRRKPGLLRAKDLMLLSTASMVMPREEHTELLEQVLAAIDHKRSASKKVRIYLSGHLCQAVKPDILDLVEDVGGVVVADDLYAGLRYVATDTRTDVPAMEALARRYLEQAIPCPTRSEPKKEWADYVVETVHSTKARGVVVLVVKFCEAQMIYYPYLKDVLAAAGIPHLFIETEHEVVSLEGMKTRLQAFMEMLER